MDRNRRITARRCPEGHVWLYQYDRCPDCGGRLVELSIRAEAVLESHTTMRVNPTGSPVVLGVARAAGAAKTLCVIGGKIRGNGRDRVFLVVRDGRFYALPRRRQRGKPRR